jgi:hypothetical protein
MSGAQMSMYITAGEVAAQRHGELIKEAAAWRRGREAKRAEAARRAQPRLEAALYCRRAAAGATAVTRCPA